MFLRYVLMDSDDSDELSSCSVLIQILPKDINCLWIDQTSKRNLTINLKSKFNINLLFLETH